MTEIYVSEDDKRQRCQNPEDFAMCVCIILVDSLH